MTKQQRHQIWQEHIEAWNKSGLTQKAYCHQHGLKLVTFGSWLKRLRATTQEPVPFINVSSRAQEDSVSGKMVIQLLLPNGVRLGLNEHASESLVRQVLHFCGAL